MLVYYIAIFKSSQYTSLKNTSFKHDLRYNDEYNHMKNAHSLNAS